MKQRSFIDISRDILEGMESTKQEMIEKGLWHDKITLDEWSDYAGKHVLIKECDQHQSDLDP